MSKQVLYVHTLTEDMEPTFDASVATLVVIEQLSEVICNQDTTYYLDAIKSMVSQHVDGYIVGDSKKIKAQVGLLVFKVLDTALRTLPYKQYRLIGIKYTRSKLIFKVVIVDE